jgi:CRISPR-associated protein Cas4
VYGQQLWDMMEPKITSEQWVESPELRLQGFIDQVEVYADRCVPIEIKSGSAPRTGVWDTHQIQVAAYAMILRHTTGKQVEGGIVRYLEVDETRPVSLNPFLELKVRELQRKVETLLKNTELPERCEHEKKCDACTLKEQCFDDALMSNLVNK